jgi:hypothetical protein
MEKTARTVRTLLTVAEVSDVTPPGVHPAPIAKPGPLPRPK